MPKLNADLKHVAELERALDTMLLTLEIREVEPALALLLRTVEDLKNLDDGKVPQRLESARAAIRSALAGAPEPRKPKSA